MADNSELPIPFPKTGQTETKKEDFYVKLVIHKGRRRGLALLLIIFFMIFTGFIFAEITAQHEWIVMVGPVLLLGGLVMLLPPTEEWEYTPWQSKAQQYERHISTQSHGS